MPQCITGSVTARHVSVYPFGKRTVTQQGPRRQLKVEFRNLGALTRESRVTRIRSPTRRRMTCHHLRPSFLGDHLITLKTQTKSEASFRAIF